MNTTPRGFNWLWLGVMAYVFVLALYFVARYAGRWAEADSATFTTTIRAFVGDGRLVPSRGEIYANGYAYQAISTFIASLAGIDIQTLQQLVYPFVASLIVLPAWALYRELTGNARGATLATILLFVQPEFLFVILRSSHEKFTRTLMLLALFWLVRSFNRGHRSRLFAVHVVLFYITVFALITSNSLLAHSFIFAIAVAMVLAWLLQRRSSDLLSQSGPLLRRFPYILVISLGLAYLFMFYAYPPAQHELAVLQDTGARVAALFLDVQTTTTTTRATDPYATVAASWINLPVYFLVSIANWLLLIVSMALWLRQGVRWLSGREVPAGSTAWLLWLLYLAFAVQGVLSVVADVSGALSSNLQHRLFPSFTIVAVALVGTELASWRPDRLGKRADLVVAAGLACLAFVGVLKATNEPVLSNKWTFYRPYEVAALQWSDAHLEYASVWTEFDERLWVTFRTEQGESSRNNDFGGKAGRNTTRDILLTEITRLRSSRLRRPLPVPADAFRVYDNGAAELYHLRPRTPYQR